MIPTLKDAQPQRLVVTLVGAYVRDQSKIVWSGGLVQVLDVFGLSAQAARIALARMVRRGLLEPQKRGRTVHYALTDRMMRAIRRGDKRLFNMGQVPAEDEPWTLLWHVIPDTARHERALLGRRLRFEGFGSPNDGMWLSPADRKEAASEVVAELKIEDHCSIFLGRPGVGEGTKTLIDSAWDLDALASDYKDFVKEFSPFRAKRRRDELDDIEALRVHMALTDRFRAFASSDPGLPAALATDPKTRKDSIELFNLLYSELQAPAQRAFDALTAPRG